MDALGAANSSFCCVLWFCRIASIIPRDTMLWAGVHDGDTAAQDDKRNHVLRAHRRTGTTLYSCPPPPPRHRPLDLTVNRRAAGGGGSGGRQRGGQ